MIKILQKQLNLKMKLTTQRKIKIVLEKKNKEFIKDNKLILKTRQRFKSERHNVFQEKINKIASTSNYVKRIQSIEIYRNICIQNKKDLVNKKEEIKYNNITKQYKNY